MSLHCHLIPKLHAFICPAGGTHHVIVKIVVHAGVLGLRVIGLTA